MNMNCSHICHQNKSSIILVVKVSISVNSMNNTNMITLHSNSFKTYKFLIDEKILLYSALSKCLNKTNKIS